MNYHLMEHLAKDLGVKHIPNFFQDPNEFSWANVNTVGAFDRPTYSIYINLKLNDHPEYLTLVTAHELVHARQHEQNRWTTPTIGSKLGLWQDDPLEVEAFEECIKYSTSFTDIDDMQVAVYNYINYIHVAETYGVGWPD